MDYVKCIIVMRIWTTCLIYLDGRVKSFAYSYFIYSLLCYISVQKISVRFTANAFRVEIPGSFVIMFLEHSILTKMASSILKNSSSRLMLRQPEPRQKNSSGLLGKVMNYLKETLQKSFGKRMYISLLFLILKCAHNKFLSRVPQWMKIIECTMLTEMDG